MAERPEAETCEFLFVHEDIIKNVQIPEDEVMSSLAELFKLFSDPTRLKILMCLSVHELCVCDLAQLIDMNQSAVSHQLRLLKQARLVKNRREGKSMFYSLADHHVVTMLAQGMEHVCE